MIRFCPLILVAVCVVGCGANLSDTTSPKIALFSESTGEVTVSEDSAGNQPNASSAAMAIERKIIYEANLQLVVEDFATVEKEIPKIIEQHDAYIADVSLDRISGRRRSGKWQVRVPVDQYEAFLDALTQLGIPESRRQTAKDVTEEYLDLETRITNKKRLEQRLLELLDSAEGKLNEIIEVERELARVRTEVEQMEGRIRYLTNRISFSSVTVHVREQVDYLPPQAPTFAGRVKHTWQQSLHALRQFGANAAIAIVAAAPWLTTLAAIVSIPMIVVRRRLKRRWRNNRDQSPPA